MTHDQKQSLVLPISIFCDQKRWHQVLAVIKDQLKTTGHDSWYQIYLSHERGTSVRLLVKFTSKDMKPFVKNLNASLSMFFSGYTAERRVVQLPLTSFFSDYANNIVRYNLFEKENVVITAFDSVQEILSRLLLHFFDDHPVDDEGSFTFLLYVQHSILRAFCKPGQLPDAVLKEVIADIRSNKQLLTDYNQASMQLGSHEMNAEMLMEGPEEVILLLKKLEEAVKIVAAGQQSTGILFFKLMQVVQLHLYKIEHEVIMDALVLMEATLNKKVMLSAASV